MTSPFAQAKTIRDIGSYLPCEFGGLPYDREEHGRAAERWRVRSEAPPPPTVRNPEYFRNATFDADILGLEFNSDFVRITVDMDDAHEFARDLAYVLELPRPLCAFPVELVIHDPRLVRAVAHNDMGDLFDIDVRDWRMESRGDCGVLSNEWFFSHGDRLGWVVDTFGLPSEAPHPMPHIHLLIDGSEASAVDRRLDVLVERFGPAVVPLWNDARKKFGTEGCARYFWNDELTEFLTERIQARGLPSHDFTAS